MVNPNIVSEAPVTMAKLKEDLEKVKARDGELNFRAGKTEEYLNQFVSIDSKKAEELMKKIEALNIPRLKNEHMIKITDLLPKTADELKTILQGYTVSVTKENMAKIVAVVNETTSSKK
jgi:DNA-directed RNA polymerase subunit F